MAKDSVKDLLKEYPIISTNFLTLSINNAADGSSSEAKLFYKNQSAGFHTLIDEINSQISLNTFFLFYGNIPISSPEFVPLSTFFSYLLKIQTQAFRRLKQGIWVLQIRVFDWGKQAILKAGNAWVNISFVGGGKLVPLITASRFGQVQVSVKIQGILKIAEVLLSSWSGVAVTAFLK